MSSTSVVQALTVLEFLIKRGSDQCVVNSQVLLPKLEDLQVFEYTSPDGRDHGVNVRHRAQAIAVLLKDSVRLEQERAAFANKRQVYKGFSKEQLSNGIVSRTHSADSMEGFSGATSSYSRQQGQDGQMEVSAYNAGRGASTHSSSAARNAGEMKGVTMEENKQQLAALKRLLDLPHNKQCADCVGGGGAARASWASINTGVFICMRCAGIHRGLGVHVSKVRSCTLDTWLPQQVSFMAATGNAVANGYWEAKLTSNQKPHYESSDLEPFIRRKYCNKEFADGTWPPALPDETTPAATAGGSQPQLASATSAGRLEAGGFWGSLTPQESGVAVDLLSDAPPGTSLTSVIADSPALLIDLMDFGAESTFQLPTTPRRRHNPQGSGFGTAGSGGMPSAAVLGGSSSGRGGAYSSTVPGAAPSGVDSRNQGSGNTATAAGAPGVQKQQQSTFPLLRPPPQVTRQLGPVQQPKQPAAAPTPITAPHTYAAPSQDMAVNTDMGGLEELVMNPNVMADPFSLSQGSYPPQHVVTDAGISSKSSDYSTQQQPTWASAPPPGPGPPSTGPSTAAAQPERQPGQPIFFQGQWFMPAPPGFTPPPGLAPPQQHQQPYSGVSQHLQGPHTPQAPPQQCHHQHQQGGHSYSQQSWQQPQQQLYQQSLQQLQTSIYARTPQNAHMPPGQSAAAPGLPPPANKGSAQDQVWSPTGAYQFESPTFRNGAAQQLSPGESGRTWSPVASDVTRLTLPQPETVPPQQRDSIAVLDDLLQHALEGLQVKAQLDTGTLPKKAPMQTAMKEHSGAQERKGITSGPQVQVYSDASSSFGPSR
ncbi:hypothetical protein ABBQ32_000547 [Trebouxia sp. C0010 RCD-2024]